VNAGRALDWVLGNLHAMSSRPSISVEESARQLAYSLGISLFVRDGCIFQHPPGKEFSPGKGATADASSYFTLHGEVEFSS
jgi:hypothetical protein